MKAGDIVKLLEPNPDEDQADRWHVVEMRGDRVLVEPTEPILTGMITHPQSVFLVADLEVVAGEGAQTKTSEGM